MGEQHCEKKSRRAQRLPVLRIEIETSDGETAVVDPNHWVRVGLLAQFPIGAPFAGRLSDCSGKPATHLYREDDVELALTLEELDRLARLDLRAKEFKALRDKFGIFHAIHGDFYWTDTGRRAQPRPQSKDFAHLLARSVAAIEAAALGEAAETAPARAAKTRV